MNTNSVKFDDVYRLLAEYDFTVEDLPNFLKCRHCKKILRYACVMPCGCRFCLTCINELLDNVCDVCPGSTEECQKNNLLAIRKDYNINRNISKLVVKCPEEACSFECELINMADHLRDCPIKSLQCVFHGFGCDEDISGMAKMNEHLQLKNYSHMRILVGIIDILMSEVNQLKVSDARNKNDIEILKRNSVIQNRSTESSEKKEINENFYNWNLENRKSFPIGNTEINETQQDWVDALCPNCGHPVAMEKHPTDTDSSTSPPVRKIDKTFIWVIDNVAQRRRKYKIIRSEYFYAPMQPYKMSLTIFANGNYLVKDVGVSIRLYIYPDLTDGTPKWPAQADVRIEIVNRAANHSASQSITNRCRIESHESGPFQCDDFSFFYSDLSTASLLIGDRFVVVCYVELE